MSHWIFFSSSIIRTSKTQNLLLPKEITKNFVEEWYRVFLLLDRFWRILVLQVLSIPKFWPNVTSATMILAKMAPLVDLYQTGIMNASALRDSTEKIATPWLTHVTEILALITPNVRLWRLVDFRKFLWLKILTKLF